MTALVIMNKDTRDGRRGRSAHEHYVPPPHMTITYLDYCQKKNKRLSQRRKIAKF
jgi:hypothetical protein